MHLLQKPEFPEVHHVLYEKKMISFWGARSHGFLTLTAFLMWDDEASPLKRTRVRVLVNYSAGQGVGGGGHVSECVWGGGGGVVPGEKSFLPRVWKAVADGDMCPGNALHPITNPLSIS